MPDLALAWNLEAACADLVRGDEDLASDGGMQTAILLSLCLDRRAEDDDPLPGDPTDRRGWWADQFLENEGDRIGSRIWLLERSKLTPDIAARAAEYGREALAWLLEDGVASRIEVETEVATIDGQGALGWAITAHRSGGAPISLKFAHVWAGGA